jgi:TetR/AcrR family transcriptional repressor of nem operon
MRTQKESSGSTLSKGQEKRGELLRVGVAAFSEKGFYNTTVDELVAAAGVPKGSFAYYFGSKDAYTLAVIEAYAEYFNKKLDRIFSNKKIDPFRRIKAFTDEAASGMHRFKFRRGCLVGNLGQELGALDETFRKALLMTLQGWQSRFRTCLQEAQMTGYLSETADADSLARLFWFAWEGAVLGAKLEKSRAPLDTVSDAFIGYLRSLAPVKSAP